MTDPLQYSGNDDSWDSYVNTDPIEQETIDDALDKLPTPLRNRVIETLYGQDALQESGLIKPLQLPEPLPLNVPEMPYSVASLRPMVVQTVSLESRSVNYLRGFLRATVGCLWFGLGMGAAAVGIGLCVTLVGAPVGLLALWASGACGLRALACWGLPAVA